MNPTYCIAQAEELYTTTTLPAGTLPLEKAAEHILPPQISNLHMSIAQWANHKQSPGVITPKRIWIAPTNEVYFEFMADTAPAPLAQTGMSTTIAAWLLLIDRWMETFVVVARARTIWSPSELAGALTFITPAFLPAELLQINPQWDHLAQTLALAVADGPLAGNHSDKKWQSKTAASRADHSEQSTSWQTIFGRKSE